MERRFTADKAHPVKMEARADAEPVISGYGAVAYDGTPDTEYELWDYAGDRAVERIMPGAFNDAISRPDDVRGLFNHEPDNLLGRTTSGTMNLSIDSRGLKYEIKPGKTTIATDVQEHLKRGDVTGSSFAFTVDEERWTETTSGDTSLAVREILKVTLYDVGPVTYPAYDATSAGMRKAGDVAEAKESREAHRRKQAAQHTDTKLPGTLAGYRARAVEVIEQSS